MIDKKIIINALENTTITKNDYTFHIGEYDWTEAEFRTFTTTDQYYEATIGLEEMLLLLNKTKVD